MIISRTPFRISFFGGGTDYPVWFEKNGGAVLSTTIDKYCYINVRYLPPFFKHKHRIVYSLIENVRSAKDIRHPVVRALMKVFKVDKGLEIHHDGDLPARSGLGSSSAFTVGMLNALYALNGRIVPKADLAKEAIRVERYILKENVGSQDQVAVAYGGFQKIVFHNDHSFSVEPMTLERKRVDELQAHLMLVFTGQSRFASEIAADQIRNTKHNMKALTIMHELVDESVCILNSKKDLVEFGKLLHEAWLIKKNLSAKVSNPAIDGLYAKALSCGATGGKLLGAGGGGFMLLFVRPENRQNVSRGLKKYLEVKFKFDSEGSQIIYYNPQDL
jgi:D-glycero-alpha-D-manno-heptose-7-phosphate kinase